MTETPKRGRPAGDDPKEAVTIRIRRSVLAAYKANGDAWRTKIEAAVEAGCSPAGYDAMTTAYTRKIGGPALKAIATAVEADAAEQVRATDALQFGPTPRKPGSLAKKGAKK